MLYVQGGDRFTDNSGTLYNVLYTRIDFSSAFRRLSLNTPRDCYTRRSLYISPQFIGDRLSNRRDDCVSHG